MKVLIDIAHPAHVHFFRNSIVGLKSAGCSIIVTSRQKDCATQLLEEFQLPHSPISSQGRGGIGLLRELAIRDWALYRVAARERPDVMMAIGGTFIAHVSAFTGIPSIVYYDTENAKLQNAITYPFASCVVAPRAYKAWLPRSRHLRYAGYHELAYLHPRYFAPDRGIAIDNGLAPQGATFLIRVVSWQANHDVGEVGWSEALLRYVVGLLQHHGKVILSAEGGLPADLESLRYNGRASALHHVLAYSRLLVGESATLCSEAAVLGVPSIYAAHTGRGYTDEQEQRYHLVRNMYQFDGERLRTTIDELLEVPTDRWAQRRAKLLEDTIDVNALVMDMALNHRERLKSATAMGYPP
jgi:predicted glycosyltransferase